MIAFEISLNGERLHTIGIRDVGHLDFFMSWARLQTRSGTIRDQAGAIASTRQPEDELKTWSFCEGLKVGDVVSVRVIETDKIDLLEDSDVAEDGEVPITQFEIADIDRISCSEAKR